MPDEFVSAFRVSPVCVLVATTVTPGMTAPVASVTTPVILPEACCAARGKAKSEQASKAAYRIIQGFPRLIGYNGAMIPELEGGDRRGAGWRSWRNLHARLRLARSCLV